MSEALTVPVPEAGIAGEDASLKRLETRNMRHLVHDRAYYGIASAGGQFMTLYALYFGATAAHLGWIASLPGLMMFIATFLSVAWRGRYATSASAQVLPSLLGRLSFILPLFTPLVPTGWQIPYLVAVLVLPALPNGIATSLGLAVMQESVRSEQMVTLLSRRQVALNLFNGAMVLGLGAWLAQAPFPQNYQSMFVLTGGAALMSWWHINQTRPLFSPQAHSAVCPRLSWRRVLNDSLNVWREPRFQQVARVVGSLYVVHYLIIAIVPLYLVQALNADERLMAWYGMATLAGGTLGAWGIGRAKRRWQTRLSSPVLMLWGMLVGALGAFMLILSPVIWLALASGLLTGAAWTLADIGQFSYFTEQAPKEDATPYSSAYLQVLSLALFISPLPASWLAEGGVSLVLLIGVGAGLRALHALWLWRRL